MALSNQYASVTITLWYQMLYVDVGPERAKKKNIRGKEGESNAFFSFIFKQIMAGIFYNFLPKPWKPGEKDNRTEKKIWKSSPFIAVVVGPYCPRIIAIKDNLSALWLTVHSETYPSRGLWSTPSECDDWSVTMHARNNLLMWLPNGNDLTLCSAFTVISQSCTHYIIPNNLWLPASATTIVNSNPICTLNQV